MPNTNHFDSAFALFQQEKYEAAAKQAEQIVPEDHHYPRAIELLALCYSRRGHDAECLALLEHAHQTAPDNPSIAYNLGVTAAKLDQRNMAMLAYQVCLRYEPDNFNALWNYSELLRVEEHFSKALELLKKCRGNVPAHWQGDWHHRLGVTLSSLGRQEEALDAFGIAIDQSSEPDLTYWEYSHALLATGNWTQGWQAYDHRFAAAYKTHVRCHSFELPHWQGESLAGKRLLIHGEQGLGDEIMFANCIASINPEKTQITLACQPPLVRLMMDSFPQLEVVAHQVGERPASIDVGNFDYQCAIGSLPRWLRATDDDYALKEPAIKSHVEKSEYFEQLLLRALGKNAGKFRVGLMWGSNPAQHIDWGSKRAQQKSIPIRELRPLAAMNGEVTFISLQNVVNALSAAQCPELDMLDLHRELTDMSDTAALVDNLDLVISVDTSVAHLAGSMGKPVWVALMQRADWRWQYQELDSIWYPSARLFRQNKQGEWAPVIQQICAQLKSINERSD